MSRIRWIVVDFFFHGICGIMLVLGANYVFGKMGYPYHVILESKQLIELLFLGIPGSILLFCVQIYL